MIQRGKILVHIDSSHISSSLGPRHFEVLLFQPWSGRDPIFVQDATRGFNFNILLFQETLRIVQVCLAPDHIVLCFHFPLSLY